MPRDPLPNIADLAHEVLELADGDEARARVLLYQKQAREKAVREQLVRAGIDAAFRANRAGERDAALQALHRPLSDADMAKAKAFMDRLPKKGQSGEMMGDPERRRGQSVALLRCREFLKYPLFGGDHTLAEANREMLTESMDKYGRLRDTYAMAYTIHEQLREVLPDDVMTLGQCLEDPKHQGRLLAVTNRL